jgi:hypothetical protein
VPPTASTPGYEEAIPKCPIDDRVLIFLAIILIAWVLYTHYSNSKKSATLEAHHQELSRSLTRQSTNIREAQNNIMRSSTIGSNSTVLGQEM